MGSSLFIPPAFAVASPWLLAGGVLLAGIPILIHLLRRQRCETLNWGAMQFVQRAARRRSRRTRLEALLLLAVRTLIILFMALALARPYVEVSGGAGDEESAVQHVIIVDTSASMAHTTDGRSRFQRAIDEATRIVESARVGDAFNLLRIGVAEPFTVIRRPAYDVADVKGEIARLQCTDERGRVLDVLEEVPSLLADDSDVVRREVYLLTDLQATNWPLESPAELERVRECLAAIGDQARLTVIDVGEADAENAAVIDVRGAVRQQRSRLAAAATATLRNEGHTRRPGQRVELWINGQLHETRAVDLPGDAEQTVSFDVPLSADSDAVVEVRLPPDELTSDDSRWLVLPPARDDRVLLVDGEAAAGSSLPEASGFLKLALQPDAASAASSTAGAQATMVPVVISDGMLADVRLDEFDCVYLCNVALLTEREANLLEQFVVQGGGLVVVLGDAVRSANYNELLYGDERRMLPARILGPTGTLEGDGEGFEFDVEDYAHPILAPFQGNETAGLVTTRIDRYVQTEPDDDPATRVVLRYSSGDPAILERTYGDGRVVLVTTALDDYWGNWALWPSFVPMMHELTRYASTGDFGRRERLVGEQIVRRIPGGDRVRDRIVLTSADGRPLNLRVRMGRSGPEAVSPPLRTRGPCKLRLGGPDVESYVVNIDPAESDLAKLDGESVENLFPPGGELRYLKNWQPRTAGDATSNLTRNGLSTWFLIAACCLLLVEQLMAWKFALGATTLGLVIAAALIGQLTGSLPVAAVVAGVALLAVLVCWRLVTRRAVPFGRGRARLG